MKKVLIATALLKTACPPRAVLTINGKKIFQNIKKIATALAKEKKISIKTILNNHILAVVKANAYGLNIEKIAPILFSAGIKNWGIATAEEAHTLKKILTTALLKNKKHIHDHSIFLLGNALPSELPYLIKHNIVFGFSSLLQFTKAIAVAKKIQATANVQWLINTGMGRLGTPTQNFEDTLENLVLLCKNNKHCKLHSAYSHLASAENANNQFTQKQLKLFLQYEKKIAEKFPKIAFHIAASSGIQYPEAIKYNYCRIGIGIYGAGTYFTKQYAKHNKAIQNKNALKPLKIPLEPTLTFEAAIVSVRWLLKGSPIGYNSTYHLQKSGFIATVAAGYADGVIAKLKNFGKVIINKNYYAVVGKVSMDYTTVFLGSNQAAKEIASKFNKATHNKPFYATFIGEKGKEKILVDDWAKNANISLHNVLTSIGNSGRVSKKFITHSLLK